MTTVVAAATGRAHGRVLIIEDDACMRELESMALQHSGWDVTEACCGHEGLAIAAQMLPEVIICDRGLPDIDGTAVIAALGADPTTSAIPIVMVTGLGTPDDIVAGIDAGAHDYLVKPFLIAELEVRCRAALRVSRQHCRLARSEHDLRQSEWAYRRIVDLAAEGVCVVQPDQTFTFANARMGELLGVPGRDLVGRSVLEFTDDEGRRLALARMEDRRAGRSGSGDFKFVRPDGGEVWTSFNATPIFDDGVFEGSIALISDVTQRHRHEDALARSEARYRALLDHVPDTVAVVFDSELRVVMAAGAGLAAHGLDATEMVGKRFDELVAAEDAAYLATVYRAAFQGERTSVEFVSHRNGAENLLDVVPIAGLGREPAEILAVARNIGSLKARERALDAAQRRWRAAFEQAPVGMAQISLDGRYQLVNPALCRMLGYTAEQLRATTPVALSHPDDMERARRAIADVASGAVAHYTDQKRYLDADGGTVWCAVSAVALRDRDGSIEHLLAHYQDISEIKRIEAELQDRVLHDPLTGLLNRRGFEEALFSHVASVDRYGADGALIVLDLDNLKATNDTYGHEAGDRAITTVAEILSRRLRATDTISRLGGDEFAVIVRRVDRHQAGRIAGELVGAIRGDSAQGDPSRALTASVGVAMFDTLGRSGQDVQRDADTSMYAAKKSGRDRYAIAPPAARNSRLLPLG